MVPHIKDGLLLQKNWEWECSASNSRRACRAPQLQQLTHHVARECLRGASAAHGVLRRTCCASAHINPRVLFPRSPCFGAHCTRGHITLPYLISDETNTNERRHLRLDTRCLCGCCHFHNRTIALPPMHDNACPSTWLNMPAQNMSTSRELGHVHKRP